LEIETRKLDESEIKSKKSDSELQRRKLTKWIFSRKWREKKSRI